MRLYPLISLRDWRDACGRSQVRANRQRANEPWITGATVIEAIVFATLILVLLVALRASGVGL